MTDVALPDLPPLALVPSTAVLAVDDGSTTGKATVVDILTGGGAELAARPQSAYTAASNDAALLDARKCIVTTRATAISLRIRLQSAIVWLADSLLGGINTGVGALTLTAEAGVTLNGTLTVPQNGWWWAKRTAADTWQVFVGGNSGTGDLKKDGTVAMTADFNLGTHKAIGMSPGAAGTDGTNKNQLDAVDTAALKKDGSVGLTADWPAGAHDITITQDPGSANALTRKSYVDAAIAAAVAGAGGGGGDGFSFTFSATTTDADPGAGTLRFNNATPASVTSIFVDLTDTNASDITAWLDRLDDSVGSVKGYIRVGSKSAATKWHLFSLASVTTATGYRKLVVTYVAGSGGLPNTTAGDTFLSFESMGIIGVVPVSSGGTGLTALGGPLTILRVNTAGSADEYGQPHITGDGFRFTYSATTADADPGAGTLRLDSGTIASVTKIYVDLQEALGTDVTAWLDSLDDAGAAILGRIRLQCISDTTKWAVFNLTAWTTASGYRKLTVAYVAGPGGFPTVAGDTVLLFDRGMGSGDFGATNVSTTGTGSFGGTTTLAQSTSISGRELVALLFGSDATSTELPASGGSRVIQIGYSVDVPAVKPGGNAGFTLSAHDVYGINTFSQNGIERTVAPSGAAVTATRRLDRVEMQPTTQTVTSTSQISAIECDTTALNGVSIDNCVFYVRSVVVMYQNGGNNYSHTIVKEACFHKRSGSLSLRGSVGGTGALGDTNPPSVGTLDASGALIRMRVAPFDATSVTIFATMSVIAISP